MQSFLRFLLSLFFLLGVPLAASAQAPSAGPEIGVRYWLSTGSNERGHDASASNPIFGSPTSQLNYSQLKAHTMELFGRLPLGKGWFVKGYGGLGVIPKGKFTDQDFAIDQLLVFETTSSLSGKMSYGSVDIGRDLWKSGNTTFGLFAGYHYWNERLDAYGLSDTGQGVLPSGPDLGNNVPVITNDLTWNSARAGIFSRTANGRTRFQAELAIVPYARFRNEDSHLLRQDPTDLGPAPNVIATGYGDGVQLDLQFSRTYAQIFDLELGIGYRYWKLASGTGTQTQGGQGFPISRIQSERQGLMLSISKSF